MTGEKLVLPMVALIIMYTASSKLNVIQASNNCRVSEFRCKTEKCIPINKFCNGIDDCSDKSDEPPYCSRKYFTCLLISS